MLQSINKKNSLQLSYKSNQLSIFLNIYRQDAVKTSVYYVNNGKEKRNKPAK